MGIVDVLVVTTAWGDASVSIAWNNCCFTAGLSATDSITRSQRAIAPKSRVGRSRRPTNSSAIVGGTLWRISVATRRRAPARTNSSASAINTRTSRRRWAAAIAVPMMPAPTMPTDPIRPLPPADRGDGKLRRFQRTKARTCSRACSLGTSICRKWSRCKPVAPSLARYIGCSATRERVGLSLLRRARGGNFAPVWRDKRVEAV